MVAVHALRTTNVAVGVLHGRFPLLTISIHATTNRTFRLLDANIKCTYTHMPFLVIAGFLLGFCRIYIGICFGICNFFA